jgi:acyl-CoA thioester hydrolase
MTNQALPLDDQAKSASVFEWPVRVYWEDTDAGGIVFYANYLKFFERSRTEWLRHLGLGQQTLRDTTGGMFVVTDVQLKYHRAARLDDLLCVTACVQDTGRASLGLHQQAWLLPANTPAPAQPGTAPSFSASTQRTLLCEASVRIGWVDASQLKPQRMPASVFQAISRSDTHDQ